jgi:anti-anti-sigma factor
LVEVPAGSTVLIAGELDLASREVLVDAVLDALVEAGPGPVELHLDLSGVTFLACSALAGLLRARQIAAEQGSSVRIGAASDAVRRLLVLSGAADELGGGYDPARSPTTAPLGHGRAGAEDD